MSSLNEVLVTIAAQIRADAQQLIDYANEDALGGYHWNEALRVWPQGSAFGVEGQILYALVRHLKPELVVEIGGWVGMSASHIASALKTNGKGRIISVDNGVGGQPHGHMIPDYLREYVTLIPEDGRVFLNHQPPNSIDLLFEDADHSTPLVMEIARLALEKVRAGGLLVSHDAAHDFAYVGGGVKIDSPVGRAVRDGLAQAGVNFVPYLAEPSDCGVAISVMPGVQMDRYSKPIETSINNQAEVAQSTKNPFAQAFDDLEEHLIPMGNANIESVSTPPEPLATEDNPIVRVEEKKPKTSRGKGKRKVQ